MPTKALTEDLSRYDIGGKVRKLRLGKKLGLVELGQHTGLSAAMLSKIERGRVFPTLPTLMRIAYVFSVGLEHFFTEPQHAMAVVRSEDRIRLPASPGSRSAAYQFESLEFPVREPRFRAFYVEFGEVDERKLERHDHTGAELIYVISGSLELRVGENEAVLRAGDSVYFDSSVAHAYRRRGKKTCSALVVTSEAHPQSRNGRSGARRGTRGPPERVAGKGAAMGGSP